MTEWQIYWILKLDNFHSTLDVFVGISIFLIIGTIISSIARVANQEEIKEDENKDWMDINKIALRIILFVSIPMILIKMFLPTTAQAAIIFLAPKIMNNEQVQQLPVNLLELTNDWIKKKIEEVKK